MKKRTRLLLGATLAVLLLLVLSVLYFKVYIVPHAGEVGGTALQLNQDDFLADSDRAEMQALAAAAAERLPAEAEVFAFSAAGRNYAVCPAAGLLLAEEADGVWRTLQENDGLPLYGLFVQEGVFYYVTAARERQICSFAAKAAGIKDFYIRDAAYWQLSPENGGRQSITQDRYWQASVARHNAQ